MDDFALVLNAGSSSLKFSVFQRPAAEIWRQEARGQIDSIGTSSRLIVRAPSGEKLADEELEVRDGSEAIDVVAGWLASSYGGSRLVGVGHRVVHGGPRLLAPIIVTSEILKELRSLVPLAPLHQPHNLAVIDAVMTRLPHVPQVACFDTSFHRSQPAVAQLVPLPKDLRQRGLQRYGFHGLSYEYIATALREIAPEIADGRVIVAHLGSGASMCALRGGASVDCTLGFTALDGLCMGTRPGTLDPGVVLHLFQGLDMSAHEVEELLYKKSGLLGVSGVSNDMRELLETDGPDTRLAIDYFVYRACKELGALAAVLGGVDGVVFTAGIGENSPEIRRRICQAGAWMGIDLDDEANAAGGPRITTKQSKVPAWVIRTNEELMIARHTASLLELD